MMPLPVLDTFGYPALDRTGTWAFFRYETRHSSRTRQLDCGHRIDASEPYEYSVGKLYGSDTLAQWSDCDVCLRRGHSY